MSSLSARRLVELVTMVPSLPAVYLRLSAVVDHPRSSMRAIEAVVCEDPSLAGRLLRLANSAFFGFPARVDNLSRAITLVGTRQLRDLAMATSVLELFRGVSPEHVTMPSFWRHGVTCGLAARALAGWRREANPEQYFVAGLLHDIGRLVLYLKLPEEMNRILEQAARSGAPLYEIERQHLGFDHAAVGGELLRHWNLPPHLCDAVAWHHAPRSAKLHEPMAALVHVADVFANAAGYGSSGEARVPPLNTLSWQQLELPPTVVVPTMSLIRQQLADTMATLLGPPP